MIEVCIVKDFTPFQDDIYAVRHEVFTAEQGIPSTADFDGQDNTAKHVLIKDGCIAIATGRLLPNGNIGRVAVLKRYRGNGFGKTVITELQKIGNSEGIENIHLSAQIEAIDFYRKLGFLEQGTPYLKVGILHQDMSYS